MNMKRVVLALMMVFTLSFATRAYAADNSTEFVVVDDLIVEGSGGTVGDPDVDLMGMVKFGAPTSLYFGDATGGNHEGETLIAKTDGTLTWSKGGGKLTQALTAIHIPVWQAESSRFVDSAFEQDNATTATFVTLGASGVGVDLVMTKGDLFLSSGDLSVDGATTLGVGGHNLTVDATGAAVKVTAMTLDMTVSGATSINALGVDLNITGATSINAVDVTLTSAGSLTANFDDNIAFASSGGPVSFAAKAGTATFTGGDSSLILQNNGTAAVVGDTGVTATATAGNVAVTAIGTGANMTVEVADKVVVTSNKAATGEVFSVASDRGKISMFRNK